MMNLNVRGRNDTDLFQGSILCTGSEIRILELPVAMRYPSRTIECLSRLRHDTPAMFTKSFHALIGQVTATEL